MYLGTNILKWLFKDCVCHAYWCDQHVLHISQWFGQPHLWWALRGPSVCTLLWILQSQSASQNKHECIVRFCVQFYDTDQCFFGKKRRHPILYNCNCILNNSWNLLNTHKGNRLSLKQAIIVIRRKLLIFCYDKPHVLNSV